MNIKNILFDFGNVIIDIDFQHTIDAFVKLGLHNFGEVYSKASQSGIFDRLDTGDISPGEFVRGIQDMFPEGMDARRIIDAWNAIIIGIPEHRIRLIEQLKENYFVAVLSNTNAIHYPEYTRELKEKYGYESAHTLFHKAYLSFEMGLRKPSPEIFTRALESNGLKAEETLFIDDTDFNLPPAAALGINTLWLPDHTDVCSFFNNGILREGLLP